MAKKRKSSRPSGPSGPKDVDAADARLAIRTYEDIADDQEQYFLDKDKIMLEDEPQSKRLRTDDRIEQFMEASDEEILQDEDDSDEDEEDDYQELQKAVKTQLKKKKKKAGADDDEEEEQGAEEEGDDGWWGASKKEYYSADAIETEADALEEEAEAKRLQKKKLADMAEADFIFDENEWAAPEEETEEGAQVVTEELKDIEVTDDMDALERYRLLQARYPEFVPLVEEFEKLQPQLAQLQKEAENKPAKSLEAVKHWILGCYVAALASYFAILTSPARNADGPRISLSPTELRDHEVMETLVSCREAWQKVRDLQPPRTTSEAVDIDSAEEDISMGEEAEAPVKKAKKKLDVNGESKKKKKAEKERLAKAKAVEESLADLSMLLTKPKKVKKVKTVAPTQDDNHSDFGEEDTLDARTAADKAAKKKSLRFYTSQIVQKASRRADAGRDAGGDADIPYRERLKDRTARLNAEAERRGKKDSKHGTELGGDESSADEAVAKQVRDEEDGYYDMIAHRTKAKKDDKNARKEALAAASKTDRVVEVETVGEDGKRKINYQIEKNKGLAPKRKKEVRNSRVKKRKKYEERQKKLKSMKATYSGGEARGGYQGETTGIKTGLIKSVKL
ncbi:Something about silencing protein 10 [Cytospora mali]|uniref:Something about silencing protein 10 n=1 Tax=Cytospora mali TaxID=578113 RepID=A0A194VH06_CYTMA|nr:Something about silencing protein 10 [Valsa mali var. pyri (nom. inval.)]